MDRDSAFGGWVGSRLSLVHLVVHQDCVFITRRSAYEMWAHVQTFWCLILGKYYLRITIRDVSVVRMTSGVQVTRNACQGSTTPNWHYNGSKIVPILFQHQSLMVELPCRTTCIAWCLNTTSLVVPTHNWNWKKIIWLGFLHNWAC